MLYDPIGIVIAGGIKIIVYSRSQDYHRQRNQGNQITQPLLPFINNGTSPAKTALRTREMG